MPRSPCAAKNSHPGKTRSKKTAKPNPARAHSTHQRRSSDGLDSCMRGFLPKKPSSHSPIGKFGTELATEPPRHAVASHFPRPVCASFVLDHWSLVTSSHPCPRPPPTPPHPLPFP